MKLSELIKTRRTALELSLQDVANEVGITKSHVWDMEQGNSFNPCILTAVRLGKCLGVSPNAIAAAAVESLEAA